MTICRRGFGSITWEKRCQQGHNIIREAQIQAERSPIQGNPGTSPKLFIKKISLVPLLAQCTWTTDCMVFNAVFNCNSVILWRPLHLSTLFWSSFNQYSTQYSFHATGCFPTKPLSKQWTAVREKLILLQWISSILGKNIGWAGNQTSNLF